MSLWYDPCHWTAPKNGTLTLDRIGSNFDTTLAVYLGTGVGSLSTVAADDDASGLQSRVEFYATVGVTYVIAVDGFSSSKGDIQLNAGFRADDANSYEFAPNFGPLLVLRSNSYFSPSFGTMSFAGNGFDRVGLGVALCEPGCAVKTEGFGVQSMATSGPVPTSSGQSRSFSVGFTSGLEKSNTMAGSGVNASAGSPVIGSGGSGRPGGPTASGSGARIVKIGSASCLMGRSGLRGIGAFCRIVVHLYR